MTPRPSPPDPRELDRGSTEVAESMDRLRKGIDAHREEFLAALNEAVTGPLRDACSRADEAHTLLLKDAGLDEPGREEEEGGSDDSGPTTQAGTLPEGVRRRRYREGVHREVLEPLRAALGKIEVGDRLSARWEVFFNGLPSLADDLPEKVDRTEPESLYGPTPADGTWRTWRKTFVRSGRALQAGLAGMRDRLLRVMGRGMSSPSPRVQEVPLRSMAKDFLLGRCSLALVGFAEEVQQYFAGPIAGLDTAVAAWTEDWFRAEAGADLGGGHVGARFLDEIRQEIPPPDPPTQEPSEEEESSSNSQSAGATSQASESSELFLICRRLSDALATGAALTGADRVGNRMRDTLEKEWDHLAEEVRVAGSFQRSRAGSKEKVRADRMAARVRMRDAAWGKWHLGSLGRFEVAVHLLRLQEAFDSAEDLLLARIVDEVLTPLRASWHQARTGLHQLRIHAEALFDEQTQDTDPEGLAQEIDDLLRKAEDLLSDHLKEANPDLRPAELVRQTANETATNLSDGLRFLPDSIVVPVSQGNTSEVDPREGTRDLPFREIVLRSVDVLRLEAIRKSPDPLLRFLDSAKGERAEIPAIVTYNLSAAANELREPRDGPKEDLLSDAHSLTVGGLARTEKGVGALVGGMAKAWREFTEQVHHLLQESYQEIHAQVVTEGVVQEQMLSLRSQLRSRLGASATQLRTQLRKLGRRLDRILRRLRVRGQRLVRLGRSAVGAPLSQRSEAERALEILRGIPLLLESLPLVYRRLYSFHPVTDAGFLVGREKEMEWATRRVDAWRGNFGSPAIMVGPVGAGNTSVLNVLSKSILEDFQVCRMEFKTRIHTSEDLATLLAEALGLEEDERWTLSRLAKWASSRPQGEKPWAILVEHLEHLLLRAPGGTSLLEAFFSFQAQTAKDIFWLSTTSGATWKLVQKTEPLAAGLLTFSTLSVLTKNDVARLILSRHRRSGLPLEFLQPQDSNPLLRRRLRRTRGEDQKQEILRDEYFDRIYRMSEGSIAMAILLWLRSADFTSREGWLRISAPRPIRFAFLEELDLQMEFALKAFLEHGSLNLEEYGLIFQASRDEAFQVFETLQSRVLIEPVGARGSLPAEPIAVTDGERYRIPGLLSQVVATRLKNRNILH